MLTFRNFILSVLIAVVSSENILLLSSVSSISHSRWYGKLAYLLATHGHQVVVLDTDRNFFEHTNITHRMMDNTYGWLKEMEEQVKLNPDGLDSLVESQHVIQDLLMLADPSFIGCDVLLKSEGTQKFIKEFEGKQFDLIIADGFCEPFFGFASIFGNPPIISACPYLEVVSANFLGLNDNPSYVPLHMSSFSPQMSFVERVTNTFYMTMDRIITRNILVPRIDKLMHEIFGPRSPKFLDLIKNNVKLVMTAYSSVLQGAKPLPPNYISIPGFHAEKPKPLPKDIKTFLDGAKDGAILFSMGSNFKSILMSEEKQEMFLSVFKKIPQRVLWKLELENATHIPSNVMITKWLPQNDILGHPNVKAFISHGGLLGTQEAVFHGVPVLGLPLMYDQVHNMDRLERHGAGIRLRYKELNRNHVAKQIDKILNDPSYQHNMKKLSAAFKDAPQTPQERALFWIEYVLRHSKTTNYLKPVSADMEWYQLILLDVIAFITVSVLIVFYLVKSFLRFVTNMICDTKSNSTTSKKKNQ